MTVRKPFNELTEAGKKARLAKYEKERAQRGTTEVLARLVRPATIKPIKDGAKLAVFRLASYDKEKKETVFFTASAYIKAGKKALEDFYASLQKGQLVSVEYKNNGNYNNIYNLMDRSYADKRRKQNADAQQGSSQELEV